MILSNSILLLILSLINNSSSKDQETRLTIPILISSSLPSTSSLPSSIAALWQSMINELSHSTEIATSQLKQTKGFPGSKVNTVEKANKLQKKLDCLGNGKWSFEREITGDLVVHKQSSVLATCDSKYYKSYPFTSIRPSLHYKFIPLPTCSSTSVSNISRLRLCQLIAHKSILLIGDSIQFTLHDLILDYTSKKPMSCYGDLYCKVHALCEDILKGSAMEEGAIDVEGQWKDDERVYMRLPDISKALRTREVNLENLENSPETNFGALVEPHHVVKRGSSPASGTLLRFRRSDGLNPKFSATQPNYLHPTTGILEINQQWLADARRSDIVIITKPPIPLPASSFSPEMQRFYSNMEQGGELAVTTIINQVKKITENVWIPELINTLRAMRKGPNKEEQLIIYRSGWRGQSGCHEGGGTAGDGPPILSEQSDLLSLLFKKVIMNGEIISEESILWPTHIVYYNLQLILQNSITRKIISPSFGVPFIDLESSLSVMRSGMIGGSTAPSVKFTDQTHQKKRNGGSPADCLRYCFPSPGQAVEKTFLGGLMILLEGI